MKARKIVLNNLLTGKQEFISTREKLEDISNDLALALGFDPKDCFYSESGGWLQWETPTDIYEISFYVVEFLG